ncbi:MAG: hypothetical protein QGF71_00470 [Rhodospirillales bacterium]|nr:hypothetical protein [Rhodospirillales bacterium]
MAEFEVGTFNKQVREALADGRRHRDLSDDWADMHYVTIKASDKDGTCQAAGRKYPLERGYVIDSVFPTEE